MRMLLGVSLITTLLCLSATQRALPDQAKSAKSHLQLLITRCVDDGIDIQVPDYPAREKVARVADVDLEAAFPTENEGATFWFVRGKKEIFRFTVKDLVSSSVWIAVDHDRALDGTHDQAHIALTYSDGGAIGGFHVRVFFIDGSGVTDASESIDGAVAEFRSRHYCRTRGNNVNALKWIRGNLLILTEVYPTGDCGSDLGHLEGYLVSVPQGKILEHMTLNQLKHYPGVCLQNDDEN
jgi:hypothetical protein